MRITGEGVRLWVGSPIWTLELGVMDWFWVQYNLCSLVPFLLDYEVFESELLADEFGFGSNGF